MSLCGSLTLTLSLREGEGIAASLAGGLLCFARNLLVRREGEPRRRRRLPTLLFLHRAGLIVLALFLGLSGQARAGEGLECSPFRKVGNFAAPEITECSGLVVSRKNPGLLWVHNDSGDTARLFAVREDGALRGIFELARAEAVDWEDMALGPCPDPGKSCLYVGDIGDNRRERSQIQIYRVKEPSVPLNGPPVRTTLADTERFECRYPDSPHDAETLFVDPASGVPYLVTKEPAGGSAVLYRLPEKPEPGKVAVLEKVSTLPSRPSLTGGDIAHDGSMILLRDYFFAYGYVRPEGVGLAEAFRLPPYRLPLAGEEQGESLGIAPSGKEIYTASEGLGAPIHRADCLRMTTGPTAPGTSAESDRGSEEGS